MEGILKNIEAIRKEKHVTQEKMAAELGIKQSSYSSYLARESDITYSRLVKISAVLGVSVIDLIGWPERYVAASSTEGCEDCIAKESTIAHLNNYIELLEKSMEK